MYNHLKRWQRARRIGIKGEKAAWYYLKKRGYVLWDRNWSCVSGELDLVTRIESTLVFVEVKSGTYAVTENFSPSLRFDKKKEKKVNQLMLPYIAHNRVRMRRERVRSVRIDLITVVIRSQMFYPIEELVHYEAISTLSNASANIS